MNDREDFDQYASSYSSLHRENIGASGESPEYFSAYKMQDYFEVAHRCGASTSGRYLDFGSGIGSSVPHFRKLIPDARLICADPSDTSLKVSETRHGTS